MDALIGDCELESEERNGKGKAEKRASKHSFSNERATWLQTLNNLRIKRDGKETTLTPDERAALINLPYTQAKVTFKQARDKLRATFGFPAHWSEASFTRVSYRSTRKDDGSWLNVITIDGTRTPLGKYGQEATRKKAAKELKKRLAVGTMTFAELRQLYKLKEGETFEHQRKEAEIIPVSLETTHPIPNSQDIFIKLLPVKGQKSLILKGRAMYALSTLANENPGATLADLRIAIDQAAQMDAGWQFEYNRRDTTPILPEAEANTQVPIEYEDAQKAEDETLIELKGWHTLKRKLETSQTEWWENLQSAWRDPQSDNGLAAAYQMDAIAEVLTKAQTDVDVENGLAVLSLTPEQIEVLEQVRFKQYRNLSLKALRNILPGLEAGKSYAEARDTAGYKPLTFERAKYLPPLETYLYKRVRHGKETGYTELRYKDLTNPVVARAFNQARLVLNALIDKHGSPAYVHVELARDLAKSKEKRDQDKKRQEDNRSKRERARAHFIDTYKISEPGERQILKERLYQEQQGKCLYTLEELDLDRVIRDENYAEIDHVWPRSLTFDNSQENLVLVHAHANQDKGNRIPYDFICAKYGEAHWREVESYIRSCKGMSGDKQNRLLAKELDADEFLARNLVDTRYATRLFARMVRDRLLFAGQIEDTVEDIDPTDSGKLKLEKLHKTRVRTPQGGLTAFLRRSWLGDIKNREASDRHHAMDACIVALCTQKVIGEINSHFANEEKVPNRFKRNSDSTFTDRKTGEIISKQEARKRGLFLPPPWEGFWKEFHEKYESVMVARTVRRKRRGELHDANPLAFRKLPVPLSDLTQEMLDEISMPEGFRNKHLGVLTGLANQLALHDGDARAAFTEAYEFTDRKGNPQSIRAIALPVASLPKAYLKERLKQLPKSEALPENDRWAHKVVQLTDLNLKKLSPDNLGANFYQRNKKIIDALTERLQEFGGKAKKAFDKNDQSAAWDNDLLPRKNRAFHPANYGKPGPMIRSIRLPESCGQGTDVRGGIAKLGASLKTAVHWSGTNYSFQNRYGLSDEQIRGIPGVCPDNIFLFFLTKNDYVRIILKDGTIREGYFVFYTNDGEMQIRRHDLPKIVDYVEREDVESATSNTDDIEDSNQPTTPEKKKKKIVLAWRITNSENRIAEIHKFKVGVLGDLTPIADSIAHGLA